MTTTDRPRRRSEVLAVLRAALFLAGPWFVSACSTSAPNVNEYLLEGRAPSSVPAGEPKVEPAEGAADLELHAVRLRGFLDRPGLAWQREGGRAGSYRYERWAEPLEEQVARAAVRALGGAAGVEAVVGPDGPRLPGAHRLELEILACHGDWSGAEPVAVVHLLASLTAPSGEPSLHEIEQRTVLRGDDPADLVLALDASLGRALEDLRAWVGGRVSAH